MTIEQLNERISQLTDLVSSASDTIENAREMIKLAEQERDRLAEQREEQKPKFERVEERNYYYIDGCNRHITICGDREEGHSLDEAAYNNNNYFHTKERAKEVVDKINFLLKLERLHDTFCPEYVPDWDDFGTFKFSVIYNPTDKRWYQTVTGVIGTCTYFPTKEIAQKVCDILNAELESGK